MPKTVIKIQTWRCSVCAYAQDFEPTLQNQKIHFGLDDKFTSRIQEINNKKKKESMILGVSFTALPLFPEAGKCPSCLLKGIVSSDMAVEGNPEKMTTITIMGEEDVDSDDNIPAEKKEEVKAKIRDDVKKYKALEKK